MTDTESRVRAMMVEHLGVDAESVTSEASVMDDLGADSLDMVELVMAHEEEFGIKISDDELARLPTVADWVKICDEKRGA
jgi:acyl carrier protein